MQRIEELPFDSVRKLMSTKYYIHNVPTVLTKGAVDVLLDRCNFIRDNDGVRKINSSDIDSIKQQNEVFQEKASVSLLLHTKNAMSHLILRMKMTLFLSVLYR